MSIKTAIAATMISAIILGIATLPTSAVAATPSGVDSYGLNVKEFHELKVVDGINVEYFCSPEKAGRVEFESTPEVASAIIFEPNNKGKLEVKLATHDSTFVNLPVVRVYSSYLTKVENDGDSTVNVLSVASGPKLEVKLIGNGKLNVAGISATQLNASLSAGRGKITLTGKAVNAKLSMTGGSGEIDALGLQTTDTETRLMGTGWIKCTAADNLKVTGMGTGTVSYTGRPAVRIKALSLKVKRLE